MRNPLRLTLAFAATGAACSHRPHEQAPAAMPPTPVAIATVAARDLPTTFTYLGRTEGSREVEIRARISGFLESRRFVEGTDVEAGQLLFEMDARPLLAQQATARADVTTAEARAAQAEREAARMRPLVAAQAASEREADDADAAERIARAELLAAQARLQQIEVDLGYTRVTAPIAGRIGRALRPEGSLVGPTTEGLLTTLLQLDPIYVLFHRTENQQQRLERELQSGRLVLPDGGFSVELRLRDGTPIASEGRIDFSAGRLDTASGTIPMRAALANPGCKVLAGQAVDVVLRGAVLRNAIAVPQRAVLEGPQGKIVMLAESGEGGGLVAQPRPIEVGEWVDVPGQSDPRQWVVTKGLAAGDRVILDNLVRLRPGAPIVEAAATAAPTTR